MADAIAMGRRLMVDPELPRKLAEGRSEDIRPCMACLECRTAFQRYQPISCRVNAALGKEREYEIKPAARKKRVVVVGGGPGGMEAARVAAARGHEVVLYEKAPRLGGSLPLAALIKGTAIEDLPALVSYFETQLRKLGVRVELSQEFTPEIARALKPEAVVVAIGGQHATPTIPGIDRRNVLTAQALHRKVAPYLRLLGPRLLGWITRFWLPVGKRVVIIGGLLHGCQVAAFLVKRGRHVTIVEASDQLGEGIPVAMKPRLLEWLAEKGVAMLTGTECTEITDEGAIVRTKDGTVKTIIADTVITALPTLSNPALSKVLEGVVPEVYAVGDCGESRLILQAIADGSRVGHSI
jgi:2,4-dienoyl-CoA reductase (NADPH2)